MSVEELEQQYVADKRALEAIQQKVDAEIQQAKDAIYAKWQTQIIEAQEKKRTSERIWKEAEAAAALSAAKLNYPEGTIFFEAFYPRWCAPGSIRIKTGRKAKEEIVTKDTVFNSKLRSYSKPNIGQVILRVLKDDGTPSKNFVGLHDKGNWFTQEEYEKEFGKKQSK